MEYRSVEVCTPQIKLLLIRKKYLSIWRRFKENLIYKIASYFLCQDRIILLSSSSDDKFGNISALAKTLCKHETSYIWMTYEQMKEHPFKSLIILARARILVIDAASPAARIKLSKKTCLIHCWHACGAYKKIGFDAKRKKYNESSEEKRIKRIHRGISWFVCTSEETARIYAKAFRLPIERMLVFGSPRLDIILQKKSTNPKIYTILYAPTYRTDEKNMRHVPQLPNAKELQEILSLYLGEKIRLVFRSHPTVSPPYDLKGWEDWSNIPQFDALSNASILITDYSSIFFDFLVFNRPIVFYIPDLKKYQQNERGLYFSPYEYFSETTCSDKNTLINILLKCHNKKINYSNIWNKYMSSCDGNASERIYLFIKNNFKEV